MEWSKTCVSTFGSKSLLFLFLIVRPWAKSPNFLSSISILVSEMGVVQLPFISLVNVE